MGRTKPGMEQENQSGSNPAKNGWFSRLSAANSEFLLEISVILFVMAGVVLGLGFAGVTHGYLIDALTGFVRQWLGWGAFGLPLLFFAIALYLFKLRTAAIKRFPWRNVLIMEVFVINLMALLSFIDGGSVSLAEAGQSGGIIGWAIGTFLADIVGFFIATLIVGGLALLSGIVMVLSWILPALEKYRTEWEAAQKVFPVAPAGLDSESEAPVRQRSIFRHRKARIPEQFRKNFHVQKFEDDRPEDPIRRDKHLPGLDILDVGKVSRVTDFEINTAAAIIEKTLADFGLPAKVVDFRTGPSITQFAVEPGFIVHETADGVKKQKIRVSQITSLVNDLALALSAPRLRVEAPVPGKAYVGIEVPNRSPAVVRMRPILETNDFTTIESPLGIALGRDVSGQAKVADLASMPHLLIAGTTGSGKSVCIASITLCLAMNNSPEDMQLIMIDPKLVELVRFNGLPHIIGKVETELERIIGVLRWLTVEMDQRYKLLEQEKARDLDAFNQKMRRKRGQRTLPRIVVMIDELADLMMMAPDQTEHTLVRLAQMARAVGIHLVLATQRPSTDVVTGLIKANFPARISFAVASSIDSRVILDTQGAEALLGKGDMLFLSPEAAAPRRIQGVYVSDQEIERLVVYWKSESDSSSHQEAPWEEFLKNQSVISQRDDVLDQAIELVKNSGSASASMLQRRLRVGYPRAARLMDELEELGVIGRAQKGGRTREVLISKDEDFTDPADHENSEPA